MRIVLDARTAINHFPGIGRYVFNLAQGMVPQLDLQEKLVLLCNPDELSRWDLRQLAGAQVEVIDVAISPFSLQQQWRIPRLLQQLKASVYHSPYYLMPYRTNIPTLLTIYDMIPLRYPQYASFQARFLYRLTHKLALKSAQHVTTISQATTVDLHHFFNVPVHKVTTISLAADPSYTPQTEDVIAALRNKLNLPLLYLLYVGSNKPHKNLVRLVQAWGQLQPQEATLIIAGLWDNRYPEAKQMAQQLNLNNSIRFLGPIPEVDLPALYSGATAFVFPSEYEGFGLPVLEAIGCGTPVACANTSSLPEVTGDAAIFFDPIDVKSIVYALSELLTNLETRERLKMMGLEQITNFSWQKTSRHVLNLYDQIQGQAK